jgi:hypothetical protein
MTKKTKIILFISLAVAIFLGMAVVWINSDPVCILWGCKKGENTQHPNLLEDPNLLYASTFWSGMCRNEKGERGGCYTEIYFYSDGKLVKYSDFISSNGRENNNPPSETQLGLEAVSEVVKQIKDSMIMTKDCPSRQIMDAGWDYQINLDGVKKSFHNPPDECRSTFESIDGIIDPD